MKHTPGPWGFSKVEGQVGHINPAGFYNKDGTVAILATVKGRDADEALANTALIAAAPDLLAALEVVAEQLKIYGTVNTGAISEIVADAIAKAMGSET